MAFGYLTDFQDRKKESWYNKFLLKTMYAFFRIVCGIHARKMPLVQNGFDRLGMSVLYSQQFYFNNICAILMQKKM